MGPQRSFMDFAIIPNSFNAITYLYFTNKEKEFIIIIVKSHNDMLYGNNLKEDIS